MKVFESPGKFLDQAALSMLTVIETDTAQAHLGIAADVYSSLMRRVNRICHTAWPMSANRIVEEFESHFKAMQSLLNLASKATQSQNSVVGFQLSSSVGVVGRYPIWSEERTAPEARADVR